MKESAFGYSKTESWSSQWIGMDAHVSCLKERSSWNQMWEKLIVEVHHADCNGLALNELTGMVLKWETLAVIFMVSKLHSRIFQVLSHLLKWNGADDQMDALVKTSEWGWQSFYGVRHQWWQMSPDNRMVAHFERAESVLLVAYPCIIHQMAPRVLDWQQNMLKPETPLRN